MTKMEFKESKPWFESKTLWVNALMLVGAVATALGQEYTTAGALTVASVTNIVLRIITKSQLTTK